MSRLPVYNNPELVSRLNGAYTEVKNYTRLCTKLRDPQDEEFRQKHKLDQKSINEIFEIIGVKAPQIQSISIITLRNALTKEEVIAKDGVVRIVKNPVLRDHQKEALKQITKAINSEEKIGKIILPTGTGKTRIEAATIELLIEKNLGVGVYVVLTPRILLTYQLLDSVGKTISADGIQCDFLNVNSGDFDSDRFEKILLKMGMNPQKIESTTSPNDIADKIRQSKASDKPLIIFSTYHSVERVDEAAELIKKSEQNFIIDAYLYDEAQYCVTNGDFQEAPNFDSNYKFFFTATEKFTDSDDGLGMNNEGKFGKILYTEKPKTLIERGEMASVALHLVGAREEIGDSDYESKAKVVTAAFDKHRNVVKQHASQPDNIGPKMLVVCDKQDSLKGIMNSKTLLDYRLTHPWVKIYALSSDYGIYVEGYHSPRVTNGEKEKLFFKLQELEDTDEAILFHVDMVAEGMDLPGITGVLPFRNLGKIKFLQNLGRGTRLVDIDRTGLYNFSIEAKDWKNYTKPFCWVILPVLCSESYDYKKRFTDYIYALRSDYGFKTSELIVIDNIVGPPIVEEVDDFTGNAPPMVHVKHNVIKEIIQEIEESEAMIDFMDHAFEFKKLNEEEQLHLLADIFN